MVIIRIEPDGVEAEVANGAPLVRALWQAGIAVETPCGGFGLCGKCRVRFEGDGAPSPTQEELRHLTAAELAEGWRLACRHRAEMDGRVYVPEGSRPSVAQILVRALERPVPLQPAVRRFLVQVPAPSVADERSDVERLVAALWESHGVALPPETIPLAVLRALPETLRQADGAVAVVVHTATDDEQDLRLLAVEPAAEHGELMPLLGIAFDVGTTTLVGYLVDLETGEELACAARLNPQVQFGDDVVSRLCFAMEQTRGLQSLQRAVVQGLNEIIAECCQAAGTKPDRIYEAVVVGNTTMLHLLLRIDPRSIALAPYVPVFTGEMTVEARRLGLRLHPGALVTTLPCVAGYIGADTVAVALTHLWDPEGESAVALDIGTNGEIVVRHQGQYLCASAAAGPAFEGGRIYQGMRAEMGAIAQVALAHEDSRTWIEVGTIGGALPRGICGSGLIDAVAALLEAGIVDETGRFSANGLHDAWRERFTQVNDQSAFQLVTPEAAGNGEGVVLTQRDIRELQLAKGSIRAVTEVLMQTAGLDWEAVDRVYVAGAFGVFVDLRSAQRIGLLPPVPVERIQAVGNAAGAGAKLALRSIVERRRARALAHRLRHVPMTGNLRYEEALMEFIGFYA